MLPNTACLPNFSIVVLGLEIPKATLARKRGSSRILVAASIALNFVVTMRPLRSDFLGFTNVTGFFVTQ